MRRASADRPVASGAFTRRVVLGSTIAEHVGGRWAISLLAYVVNAPLNVVSIATNADASTEGARWYQWLLVGIAGYIALGLVLLVADRTTFRHRRMTPVSVGAVVGLGALAGAVRGFVVGLLAQAMAIAPDSLALVTTRVVTGAVLGALMLPIAALTLSCITSYRAQRALLVRQLRSAQLEAMQANGVTRELEQAIADAVREDLAEVARTNDANLAREVSHRIWDEPVVTSAPRMDWGALLRASVAANPLVATPVVVVWALSALGVLTAALGVPLALLQIATSAVALVACFAAGRALVRRHAMPPALALVLVVVATTTLTGPVASALFDARSGDAGRGLVLTNTLWLMFLILLTGFVDATVRAGEQVLADLRARIDVDEIATVAARDEQGRLRRELASRLHSGVQSRLLAMAAFGAPVPAFDIDALMSPAHGEPLAQRLRMVTDAWSALMPVTLDLDPAVPPAHAEPVVRIVEEALANAFRHGHATGAHVVVARAGDVTSVEVVDDGRPAAVAEPGLGSAVLTWLAPDAWSLTSRPDGTTLSVRLA